MNISKILCAVSFALIACAATFSVASAYDGEEIISWGGGMPEESFSWGGGLPEETISWGGGYAGDELSWGGGSPCCETISWGGGYPGEELSRGGGSGEEIISWGGGYPGEELSWGGGYPGESISWGGGCGYNCYDNYFTGCGSCSKGYGGEMYYSSSYSPPKYTPSSPSYPSYPVSYPKSVSYPQQVSPPIKVSTGTSYAQPANIEIKNNNTNNNENNNTNINNINVSATAIATAPIVQAAPAQQIQYVISAPTYPTYPTYQPSPYCTITITNQYGIGYGYGQATLTWSSGNANSASINPNIGSVSTFGSRAVYPSGNQVFTMTVWGPGGTASCQTQQYYAPAPITPAPYVSLSQIPYTGFDYGPIGNAIYWLSLASFAVAGAYLLVYFRGGAFAFAGQTFETSRTRAQSARLKEFAPIMPTLSSYAPVKTVAKKDAASSTGTTDSMSIAQSETGMPKIVIFRR